MSDYWEHEVETEEDVFFEIYAESEEDVMEQLADYSVVELKVLARCCSRYINHKMYKHPLYGMHHSKKEQPIMKSIKIDVNTCCVGTAPTINAVRDCYLNGPFSLGTLNPPMAVPPVYDAWELASQGYISKEKDNMITQIDTERKYLTNRLAGVSREKDAYAYEYYNIGYRPTPKTGKELKDWLASGRVVVDAKLDDDLKFDRDWGSSPLNYLVFVDPDKKVDHDGYEKETQVIAKDYTKAKDVISLLSTEQGLTALEAFEARTYH